MKIDTTAVKKTSISWIVGILVWLKDALFSIISPFKLWLAGGAVLAALVTGFIWNWSSSPELPLIDIAVPAEEADAVEGDARESVIVSAPIVIYAYGKKPKEKLSLPARIIMDDARVITAASVVKPSDFPTDVVSVLDKNTGKTETFLVRKEKEWFSFHTDGAVGVGVGVSDLGETARIYARQRAFSIKSIDFGGLVSFDQPMGSVPNNAGGPIAGPRYFLGLTAEWKWE